MIARHIADLLYDHECVVVPGFGGFIKSISPSIILKETNEIYPPFGKIAFNADLSANDGLLANHIAKTDNSTYREALYEIGSSVELWHRQLRSGDSLKLPKIGDLFLNASGQIEFKPDLASNFNAASYGLPVMHIKTVQVFTPDFNELQERPSTGKHSKIVQLIPSTLKWAAVLAPFIAFALWGSLNQDTVGNYVQNYSGLFSWVKVTPGKTAPSNLSKSTSVVAVKNQFESPAGFIYETGNVQTPSISLIKPSQETDNTVAAFDEKLLTSSKLNANYHIIGGAFRDFNNAMSLISHLKSQGYNASIIDTTAKGLFMVSIQGVADYFDAQKQLKEIKAAGYSSAWVYKMRK